MPVCCYSDSSSSSVMTAACEEEDEPLPTRKRAYGSVKGGKPVSGESDGGSAKPLSALPANLAVTSAAKPELYVEPQKKKSRLSRVPKGYACPGKGMPLSHIRQDQLSSRLLTDSTLLVVKSDLGVLIGCLLQFCPRIERLMLEAPPKVSGRQSAPPQHLLAHNRAGIQPP
jgi:hypothetical protein